MKMKMKKVAITALCAGLLCSSVAGITASANAEAVDFAKDASKWESLSNVAVDSEKGMYATAQTFTAVTTEVGGNSSAEITADFSKVSGSWGVFIVYFKWNDKIDFASWSFGADYDYAITASEGIKNTGAAGDWLGLVMSYGATPFVLECTDGTISNLGAIPGINGNDFWYTFNQKNVISLSTTDGESGVNYSVSFEAPEAASNNGKQTYELSSENTNLRGDGGYVISKVCGDGTFSSSTGLINAMVTDVDSEYEGPAAEDYNVEVAAENNLATNKWDWEVDQAGGGKAPSISADGIRFEDFQSGNSTFALYKTNRFTEFKYSMYANLNLTRPSEYGYQSQFDYSNLYISFMIDAGDVVKAGMACPWYGSQNTTYFSVCFEDLQGNVKTELYLNDAYIGAGANRKVVASTTACNWRDGNYHWFEFSFRKATVGGKEGMQFTFWFDGKEALSYFQSNTGFTNFSGQTVDFPFSEKSGYIGFWPSSDTPNNAGTAETNCFVDIQKIQIVSYDNNNTTPYTQCAAPEFDITSASYSPAASYEVGEEIEVKLSDLFVYEGEEALTYEITCDGEAIGTIRNGYWVWTPETAGTYDVDIKATTFDNKTANNYLTFRVSGSSAPVGGGDSSGGGCRSTVAGLAGMATLLLAGAYVCKRRGE